LTSIAATFFIRTTFEGLYQSTDTESVVGDPSIIVELGHEAFAPNFLMSGTRAVARAFISSLSVFLYAATFRAAFFPSTFAVSAASTFDPLDRTITSFFLVRLSNSFALTGLPWR